MDEQLTKALEMLKAKAALSGFCVSAERCAGEMPAGLRLARSARVTCVSARLALRMVKGCGEPIQTGAAGAWCPIAGVVAAA